MNHVLWKLSQTSPHAAYLVITSPSAPPEWLGRPNDPNTPTIDESGAIIVPPRIDSDPSWWFWTIPADATIRGAVLSDGTEVDVNGIVQADPNDLANNYERGLPIMKAAAAKLAKG